MTRPAKTDTHCPSKTERLVVGAIFTDAEDVAIIRSDDILCSSAGSLDWEIAATANCDRPTLVHLNHFQIADFTRRRKAASNR